MSAIHSGSGAGAERRRAAGAHAVAFAADRRRLRIGLVNNMPDAALAATERQFRSLVEAAAGGRAVELQLFHIPEIARGPEARARLQARSRPLVELDRAQLDGLIVTGAEPRADRLQDEPFWPALAGLAEWAAGSDFPSLWSCLAAHAAVLRLDGIERRPLASKCSGLYACAPDADARAEGEPMLQGLPRAWMAPHSRRNALDEGALAARGCRVLTRSREAGVDAFVRAGGGAPMLMLQGHLEYDAASLVLEFKRDLQRYLDGARPAPPTLPRAVFAPETAERLEALLDAVRREPRPELMAQWPLQAALRLSGHAWRAPAVQLYRNWLASAHTMRTAHRSAPRLHA